MRLDTRAFALACALLLGVASFAATLLSVWFGKGKTIDALAAAYFGYTRSVPGAFIGLFWGAVYGFLIGLLLAAVYNAAARGSR